MDELLVLQVDPRDGVARRVDLDDLLDARLLHLLDGVRGTTATGREEVLDRLGGDDHVEVSSLDHVDVAHEVHAPVELVRGAGVADVACSAAHVGEPTRGAEVVRAVPLMREEQVELQVVAHGTTGEGTVSPISATRDDLDDLAGVHVHEAPEEAVDQRLQVGQLDLGEGVGTVTGAHDLELRETDVAQDRILVLQGQLVAGDAVGRVAVHAAVGEVGQAVHGDVLLGVDGVLLLGCPCGVHGVVHVELGLVGLVPADLVLHELHVLAGLELLVVLRAVVVDPPVRPGVTETAGVGCRTD